MRFPTCTGPWSPVKLIGLASALDIETAGPGAELVLDRAGAGTPALLEEAALLGQPHANQYFSAGS